MSAIRQDPITLLKDCPAVLIPGGQQVTLREGDEVMLVQTLGGSFTVQSDRGYLARVAAADGEALGLDDCGSTSVENGNGPADAGPFAIEAVIEQLKTVFDPEIPINIVDLGLVYACDAEQLEDGSHRVEIKMSMTAPGCGMGDILREDARARVLVVPGVSEVEVELIWDPPWDLSRMSEAAHLELGM